MDKLLALGRNILTQNINDEERILFNKVDEEVKKTFYEDEIKFRLINPYEVENLTDSALNYLMSLRGSHKISEQSFEEILQDVSSIFGILDTECLKDLLNYRGIGVNQIIN